MNIKLDRHEVCKTLLALTAVGFESNNTEFLTIHDKIMKQLKEWDEKHAEAKG